MYENDNAVIRQEEHGLGEYIAKVYGWMFLGLLITAGAAAYVISSPIGMAFLSPGTMFFLVIIELGLVLGISFGINKISSSTATILFLLYSAINGLTLSVIFYAYNIGIIYKAFGVAAVTFGAMALYGYYTKNDLTRIGNLFRMGIIGVLVILLMNFFIRSSMLDLIISFVILFLFLGLVAYDTQKIKGYYAMGVNEGSEELLKKGAIISALALYLDFINIFLALLRIFGGRD